jgi:hypothetical protein
MSDATPATAIVAMKRLTWHLLSGCRRCVDYPMADFVLQVGAGAHFWLAAPAR